MAGAQDHEADFEPMATTPVVWRRDLDAAPCGTGLLVVWNDDPLFYWDAAYRSEAGEWRSFDGSFDKILGELPVAWAYPPSRLAPQGLLDPPIDYCALLKKYIDHVGHYEGITYIRLQYRKPGQFTEAEWKALRRLDGSSDESDDSFDRDEWAQKLEEAR